MTSHIESRSEHDSYLVRVDVPGARLEGQLSLPRAPVGIVVFAHGSGSSRHSRRNKIIAQALRDDANTGTLLVDLMSPSERSIDGRVGQLRFDVELQAERLGTMLTWLERDARTRARPIGLFGASTGAGAALVTASDHPEQVVAVVCRGGRTDLAGAGALARVRAPTLLIVGGNDPVVLELNRQAQRILRSECRIDVLPGAGHLFDEPEALEEVARLTGAWFHDHLGRSVRARDS
ncbi:MAG: dienelactone hydrolase [Myxococcaceae bacterium]|nr:dienelactone hydrolase [Myxococcaceae bacterium]